MPTIALREPNFLAQVSNRWPRGVECIIDYDNSTVVMNDLRRADRIIVENIGGLSGPDLQVSAEKNPDRDGEFPQDVTYGGRTVTLRGRVVSGSLDGMRSLYSYLLDGFDEIRDAPLWFRWMDWRDLFTDSGALNDYTFDTGSGTLSISSDGTGLTPSSTAAKEIYVSPLGRDGVAPSRFGYGDGEVIVAFKTGSSTTSLSVGAQMRRTTSSQKLRFIYEKSTNTIRINKVVGGTTTNLATAAVIALSTSTNYWLRARIEGAVITLTLWTAYPPDVGEDDSLLATLTHTLSGGDQTIFPVATTGYASGLYWVPNGTADRVTMLDVGTINLGDAVIFCRKAVVIEGDEVQDGFEWSRSFMITLRASSSLMVSRKPIHKAITPPGTPVNQAYLEQSLTNLGRSPAHMIIRFWAGSPWLKNPRAIVAETGEVLGANIVMDPPNYIEFDTSQRTVVASLAGVSNIPVSAYSYLTYDNTWPQLVKGSNTLHITTDETEAFDSGTLAANLNTYSSTDFGTTTTSGSTTDYTFDEFEDVVLIKRATVSDSGSGRFALMGTTPYTDAIVRIKFRYPTTMSTNARYGIIVRYVDANNYARVVTYNNGVGTTYAFQYFKAGALQPSVTSGGNFSLPGGYGNWFELVVGIRANGRVAIEIWSIDVPTLLASSEDLISNIDSSDFIGPAPIDLQSGGVLQTGRIGLIDYNPNAAAATRYYKDFVVTSAPIYSGLIDISYRHSSR